MTRKGMRKRGADRRRQLLQAAHLLAHYQTDEALDLVKKILREDPEHLPALEICAKAYWRAGQFADSLGALDRLIRLNPYEPGYFYLKGVCLQCLGRFGEAVSAFEKCAGTEAESAIHASAALRDLEAWQETLIADLLQEDPVFRAKLSQNAEEALRSRGFMFSRLGKDSSREIRPRSTWE
jgi:tetratricopeptide (TPR) repeat protein